MDSKSLAYKIADLALEIKGKQVVVLDLVGLTGITDYFVIITGESEVQLKALSDHIERKLREEKTRIFHKEGYGSLRWVLLDYVDVVVHIFRGETREFYGLERLWSDAKMDLVMDTKNDN